MMRLRRWPAVRTVSLLLEDGGRVLLVRRPDARLFPGTWSLPGMDLAPGEGVTEGARRVAREGLGIAATGLARVRRYPAPSPFQDSRGADTVVRVTAHAGAIGLEPGRVEWFAPGELADIVMFREARDALRALLHPESIARAR